MRTRCGGRKTCPITYAIRQVTSFKKDGRFPPQPGLSNITYSRATRFLSCALLKAGDSCLPGSACLTLILPGSPTELRARSEERRVGKECRSRWSPYH